MLLAGFQAGGGRVPLVVVTLLAKPITACGASLTAAPPPT